MLTVSLIWIAQTVKAATCYVAALAGSFILSVGDLAILAGSSMWSAALLLANMLTVSLIWIAQTLKTATCYAAALAGSFILSVGNLAILAGSYMWSAVPPLANMLTVSLIWIAQTVKATTCYVAALAGSFILSVGDLAILAGSSMWSAALLLANMLTVSLIWIAQTLKTATCYAAALAGSFILSVGNLAILAGSYMWSAVPPLANMLTVSLIWIAQTVKAATCYVAALAGSFILSVGDLAILAGSYMWSAALLLANMLTVSLIWIAQTVKAATCYVAALAGSFILSVGDLAILAGSSMWSAALLLANMLTVSLIWIAQTLKTATCYAAALAGSFILSVGNLAILAGSYMWSAVPPLANMLTVSLIWIAQTVKAATCYVAALAGSFILSVGDLAILAGSYMWSAALLLANMLTVSLIWIAQTVKAATCYVAALAGSFILSVGDLAILAGSSMWSAALLLANILTVSLIWIAQTLKTATCYAAALAGSFILSVGNLAILAGSYMWSAVPPLANMLTVSLIWIAQTVKAATCYVAALAGSFILSVGDLAILAGSSMWSAALLLANMLTVSLIWIAQTLKTATCYAAALAGSFILSVGNLAILAGSYMWSAVPPLANMLTVSLIWIAQTVKAATCYVAALAGSFILSVGDLAILAGSSMWSAALLLANMLTVSLIWIAQTFKTATCYGAAVAGWSISSIWSAVSQAANTLKGPLIRVAQTLSAATCNVAAFAGSSILSAVSQVANALKGLMIWVANTLFEGICLLDQLNPIDMVIQVPEMLRTISSVLGIALVTIIVGAIIICVRQKASSYRQKKKLESFVACEEHEYCKCPPYWTTYSGSLHRHGDNYRLTAVSQELEQTISSLMKACWNKDETVVGRDSLGIFLNRFRILQIEQIENPNVFFLYRSKCVAIQAAFSSVTSAIVKTKGKYAVLDQRLMPGVNDCYLWHGTTEDTARIICKHGFDPRVSAKGLFGSGTYFAEKSSKSNQYVG